MPEYRTLVLPMSKQVAEGRFCPAIKVNAGRIRMVRRDTAMYAEAKDARLRAEGLISFLSDNHFSLEDMARLAILFPILVESDEG